MKASFNKVRCITSITLWMFVNCFSFSQTNPQGISGLTVWLMADSSSVDGMNFVSQMNDLSLNSNNAFQGNSSSQPLRIGVNPEINNKPSILFDGSDDYLEISDNNNIDFDTGFSIFVLMKQTTSVSTKTIIAKWDYGTQSSWALETGASDGFREYIANSLTDGGGNNIDVANPLYPLSAFRLIEFIFDGSQGPTNRTQTYINGNLLSSSVNGSITSNLINSAANIRIGSFANLGRYLNGEVAEVLIYNSALQSSDRINIEQYIYDKYAPDITLPADITSTSFCDTIITTQGYYTNYLWSTGETTSTITTHQSGSYWVQATNIFGKISSDTILINFPNLISITDTVFCQGNNIIWNTGLSKNLYSFQWNDNSTDSLFNITQSGQFYVTITDSIGCSISSDTINAIRDDLPSLISLGPDVSLCAGNNVTIQSGNGPGLNYLWSNSSNNDTITVVTSGQYSIIVTDTNNCSAKDTINVTVVGQAPVAGFEIGTACENFAVSFTDTSYALSGNTINYWHWQFNDPNSNADTSVLQHPNYVFADSGTYTITLFINTDVGCSQAINKTITVHGNPIVVLGADTNLCSDNIIYPVSITGNSLNLSWNTGLTNDTILIDTSGQYILTATNAYTCYHSDTININVVGEAPAAGFTNTLLCSTDQINFTDTSSATMGNTIVAWAWDFGDTTTAVDVSSAQHPNYIFNSPGNYDITLTITTDVGCSKTITQGVTINPKPNVILGIDTNLCAGNYINPVSITGTSLSFNWNNGTTNDTIVVDTTGQYILTATNAFNCFHSDTINVTVVGQAPVAGFFNPLLCSDYVINFTDTSYTTSGNITSWLWDFGDTTTSADTSPLQHPAYTFSDSGYYNINLILQTDVGCSQILSKTIYVNKKPVADFFNAAVCQNDSITFNNTSNSFGADPTTYNWNFGDPASGSANNTSSVNPKHLFASMGSYLVTLITTSVAGCMDTSIQTITAKQQVLADFIFGKTCLNEPVIFTDNSSVPLPNNSNVRTWTINSTNLIGTNVSYIFPSSGSYPVNLFINGVNGCNGSVTKVIQVLDPPTPNFLSLSGCEFDTLSPIENSTSGGSPITQWNWQLNGVDTSQLQNPEFINLSPGTYNLSLRVTDSASCKDSITKTLTVNNLPTIDFTTSPTTFYYTNSTVNFYPSNSNGIAFNWTINGTNTSTQNTNYIFSNEGLYPVTLVQTDSNNCTNSKTKNLSVLSYRFDLAVTDVRVSMDNNNFISVETDITNLGTVPVSSYDITYNVTNTSTVLESWSGNPNNSALFTYTFSSKIQLLENTKNYLTCVTILSVNGGQDQNPDNNSYCISSDINTLNVLDPFPNPANSEVLIPVILTDDMTVTFDIYDPLGQTVMKQQLLEGTQGLNIFNLPIETLCDGQYFIKIQIKDKLFVKKITKSY